MSTTRVFTDPRSQHFKSDGVSVNSSGKLYFREPGPNSTTLKNIYSDKDLTTPFINPVILDSNGRAPEIFLNGDYNVQMTDSADVQIWRIDNYQPPAVDGQFGEWGSTLTYAVNDYVRYTDGNYYVSLQSGNAGNVPSSSPAYWSQAFFITVYNASDTYALNEIVYRSGDLYTSLQNSNTGNTPETSGTFWRRLGRAQYDAWNSSISYSVNDTVKYTDDSYYISLQNSNLNNTPGSTAYWSKVYQFTDYNSVQTYSEDDAVYYQGIIYTSLQNSNTGNTPDSSFDFWRRPGVSVPPVSGYIGQIIKYYRTSSIGSLQVDTLMTDSVWRSFGPTGSGADTVWSELDDIPINAIAITLSVQMFAERITGLSDGYSLLFDSRTNGLSNNFEVAAVGDYGSSTEPSTSYQTSFFDVPLSSSNIFDFKFNETNTDSIIISVRVVGFSVEEA